MNYIVITIYLLQFCCHGLAILPAPVNVTVESRNFEHNLRWDPGPGTPPGTTYRVLFSYGRNKQKLLDVQNFSAVVVKRTLQHCTRDVEDFVTIGVRAMHRGNMSDLSKKEFTPFTDTVLGPPEVNVSGCGNCLNLTITLPRGNAKKSISQIYKVFTYRISWKRDGENKVWNKSTGENSLMLHRLERGVKYCVQVDFLVNTNKHTLPSNWVCSFTSPKKQSPVIPILASVSCLLAVGGLGLLVLFHVGLLCKLKTHLPRVMSLVEAPSYCYFIVEEIVPDAVSCDAEGREKAAQRREVSDDEEEEDEEEEDPSGDDGYENRMARSLEGSSSDTASRNTTGSVSTATTALSTAENSGNSGNFGNSGNSGNTGVVAEEPQWAEPPGGDEIPGSSEGGEERQESESEAVDGDTNSGGDVNLLSVTLGVPDDRGGAEETGEPQCWLAPLLRTGSGDGPARLGGAHADTRADSPEPMHAATLPTLPDCGPTGTHYLQTRTNWKEEEEESEEEEEEEDEEDEEFSGYMMR